MAIRDDGQRMAIGHLKTKTIFKKKGFSEFNNSPLKDTGCTNLTEEKMKYVKLQYDCLVDNFEKNETIGE